MSIHRPPTSDSERLENLLAAWSTLDDDAREDDAAADAASGIDFDAWAGEIQAKVKAHAEAERRARAAAEEAARAAAAAKPTDYESLLRAEVDRAVAPYIGKAPPFVLRKLRELAERYWREHPTADRVLRMQAEKHNRIISGDVARVPDDTLDETTGRRKKG